jgi:hypothetical protein
MWTNENRARYDRSKLRYPSDLTDMEWGFVRPLIPPARWGARCGDRRLAFAQPHPEPVAVFVNELDALGGLFQPRRGGRRRGIRRARRLSRRTGGSFRSSRLA